MIDSVKTLKAGLTSELRLYCQSFIVYVNILKNLNFLTSYIFTLPYMYRGKGLSTMKLLELFTVVLKFCP